MSELGFKSKKDQSAGNMLLAWGRDHGCGEGRGAQPSAVGLRGWEMMVFLKGRSDNADEGRMSDSVGGKSRGVPRLLCHVR